MPQTQTAPPAIARMVYAALLDRHAAHIILIVQVAMYAEAAIIVCNQQKKATRLRVHIAPSASQGTAKTASVVLPEKHAAVLIMIVHLHWALVMNAVQATSTVWQRQQQNPTVSRAPTILIASPGIAKTAYAAFLDKHAAVIVHNVLQDTRAGAAIVLLLPRKRMANTALLLQNARATIAFILIAVLPQYIAVTATVTAAKHIHHVSMTASLQRNQTAAHVLLHQNALAAIARTVSAAPNLLSVGTCAARPAKILTSA